MAHKTGLTDYNGGMSSVIWDTNPYASPLSAECFDADARDRHDSRPRPGAMFVAGGLCGAAMGALLGMVSAAGLGLFALYVARPDPRFIYNGVPMTHPAMEILSVAGFLGAIWGGILGSGIGGLVGLVSGVTRDLESHGVAHIAGTLALLTAVPVSLIGGALVSLLASVQSADCVAASGCLTTAATVLGGPLLGVAVLRIARRVRRVEDDRKSPLEHALA